MAEVQPQSDASPELELSIVMPCLNEVRTLGACIEKAQRFLRESHTAGEVVIGDNGWIINNEIRTPPIPMGLLALEDQLQILGFFDYGSERLIDPIPADGSDPNKTLYSTGVGLRYTVSRNFSFRFDYGIPLAEKSLNAHSPRTHVGVLLSF